MLFRSKDTTYVLPASVQSEAQPTKKSPIITFFISPFGRLTVASLAGLLSYILAGYFNLDKRLNWNKQTIKLGSAVAGFIVVFLVCWGLAIFV